MNTTAVILKTGYQVYMKYVGLKWSHIHKMWCAVRCGLHCVMLLKCTFLLLCLFLPDKATHPTNRQEDWEYIIGFCDQINKELEGYVCEIFANNIVLVSDCSLIWVFFMQSSNSCNSARPQNPLTSGMGSSAGSDSKKSRS